jgi:hypothetical protein
VSVRLRFQPQWTPFEERKGLSTLVGAQTLYHGDVSIRCTSSGIIMEVIPRDARVWYSAFRATPKWMPRGLCSRLSTGHLHDIVALLPESGSRSQTPQPTPGPQSAGKVGVVREVNKRLSLQLLWLSQLMGGTVPYYLKMVNLCPTCLSLTQGRCSMG